MFIFLVSSAITEWVFQWWVLSKLQFIIKKGRWIFWIYFFYNEKGVTMKFNTNKSEIICGI